MEVSGPRKMVLIQPKTWPLWRQQWDTQENSAAWIWAVAKNGSNSQRWCQFSSLVIYALSSQTQYRRKSGAIDHTVIFVPDVWTAFPDAEEKVEVGKAVLKREEEIEEEVEEEVEEEIEKEVEEDGEQFPF